mmetsp:Transcript_33861/g.79161  ORF Transcript_33861/g.79161 Transcript_33861/m.79161 type:complete len:400 (-) Transcript_33861:135-1334(-)
MGHSKSREVARAPLLDPVLGSDSTNPSFVEDVSFGSSRSSPNATRGVEPDANLLQQQEENALEALRQLGEVLLLKGHIGPVNDCAVFPDGSSVLSAGADGTARIWDASTGVQKISLSGHEGEVRCCACYQAGNDVRAVTGGQDSTVRVWDVTRGLCLHTLRNHQGPVFSCSVSTDGRGLCLTLGDDRRALLWDLHKGTMLRSFEGPEDPRERREPIDYRRAEADFAEDRQIPGSGAHAGEISADGNLVAIVGGDDGEYAAVLIDANTGTVKHELEGRCCFGCAMFPGGDRVVTVGEEWTRHLAVVWDIESEERLCTVQGPVYMNSCSVAHEGNLVIIAGDDGRAQVFRSPNDGSSAQQVATLDCGEVQIRSMVVFQDSCRVAIASNDGTVWLWRLTSSI